MLFSFDPALSWHANSELFNLAPLPLALLLVRGERDVRRIVDGLVIVAGVVAVYARGFLAPVRSPALRRDAVR
jgi:hypothetical protein